MDKSEFKHLESIPLDEKNLLLGDSPSSNIKSKACLHLGFVALNSLVRHSALQNINKSRITSSSATNFELITSTLEQFLITSLNLSTISNLQNNKITEHYKRRCITISNLKILPDENYCENLLFSKFKPWGGVYGSLGYYNVLAEDFEEYYTPSELVYYSSKEALSLYRQNALNQLSISSDNNYRLMASVYTDLYKTLDEDTEEADNKLYSFSSTVITRVPQLALVYRELDFYSKWLPKVYLWYQNKALPNNLKKIEEPRLNKERALNTLLDIAEVLIDNLLDETSFINLASKLIRQTIGNNIFDIFDSINYIRQSTAYLKLDSTTYDEEELLLNELLDVLTTKNFNYNYRDASYLILSSLAPPSGYAMLLNLIGCNLLNRAYILAYKELELGMSIANSVNYNRIIRLIGLSSICFTKTNIKHIVNNGLNLMSVFKLNITNIQINNLLDIYGS